MNHPINDVGKQCMVFFGKKWNLGRIDRYESGRFAVTMKELRLSLSFEVCDVHIDLVRWEKKFGKIWGITFKKKVQV